MRLTIKNKYISLQGKYIIKEQIYVANVARATYMRACVIIYLIR